MILKTSVPAMTPMTLIQMLLFVVSHQLPQMMNTTRLVTAAWIVMALVMMKRTAMLMVMISNHVVRTGYLSYLDTLKVKECLLNLIPHVMSIN